LKSISDLESSVLKYVSKNTPSGLPGVSKFIKCYVQSLLNSDLIRGSLASLDSRFDFGLSYDEESGTWVEGDALHFILKDFCSVVGLGYKPEYKEAILRSFVCKDEQFFKWLFTDVLEFPVLYTEIIRSGVGSVYSFTDESGGFTDKGILTDLTVRGYLSLAFFFSEERSDEVVSLLEKNKDLLSLVLPARLFINFFFV